jgi:hypothetical protein
MVVVRDLAAAEPHIDRPPQTSQPPVTMPGHLILARILRALTPASNPANATLFFTKAVGSSSSWHCCHGRRKHSSIEGA